MQQALQTNERKISGLPVHPGDNKKLNHVIFIVKWQVLFKYEKADKIWEILHMTSDAITLLKLCHINISCIKIKHSVSVPSLI